MASLADRILAYLVDGIKPQQIASIVGCTPAYVSQLCADAEFNARYSAAVVDSPRTGDERLETKYEGAEHRLIDRITADASNATFAEATRALESIAKIRAIKHQTKVNPLGANVGGTNVTVVQLMLPAHAAAPMLPAVTFNENNEIVSVGNQSLAPMSSDGVKKLFSGLNVPLAQKVDQKTVEELFGRTA